MFKNVAGQKIKVQAIDRSTGGPKTGDAANITVYVTKDNGAVTALTDTSATELSATNAPGIYMFDLTQAETNADDLLFTGKSSTANVDIVPVGYQTVPANFTALSIDINGRVKVQTGIQKNTALAAYPFVMTDSTTHAPVPGKTVTVTRSLDGGAFAATTAGTATEVSNGDYKIDLSAADMNANTVLLRMTAAGCDDLFVLLITTP